MSRDYEQYVTHMEQQFPELFKDQHYGGFAVGEGWWPMIETLCGVIQNHLKQSKDCPPVKIEQIKEKFGSLRFYIQGGDEFIQGAIWMAESMSCQLCEECGAPGERRTGGWVRTLCDHHEAERQAQKVQQ